MERWNIFKISFGSGKALNYVEYGRKKICCGGYLIEDAGRKEARGTRANGIQGHFGVKTFEERNDIMKVGREH